MWLHALSTQRTSKINSTSKIRFFEIHLPIGDKFPWLAASFFDKCRRVSPNRLQQWHQIRIRQWLSLLTRSLPGAGSRALLPHLQAPALQVNCLLLTSRSFHPLRTSSAFGDSATSLSPASRPTSLNSWANPSRSLSVFAAPSNATSSPASMSSPQTLSLYVAPLATLSVTTVATSVLIFPGPNVST